MKRLLSLMAVALVALGLASCGGSKSESADTSAAPTTSSESGGGSSSGGTSSSGSGSGSEFCVAVGEVFQRHADAFQSVPSSPQLDPSNPQAAMQQMQEYGQKLLAPMQEIQQVAPPEVKSDIDALVAGFQALASADPQALATAGTQLQSAGQNFASYMATNCPGTNLSGLGGGGGTGSGTATGPN